MAQDRRGGGEAAEFLARHPQTRWIDAMVPDIGGVPRGKRLHVSALDKLYGEGMALPGSTYAMDILGNNVDATGLGAPDGDPDYPCHPVPGTLAPVPWAGPERAQLLLSMSDGEGRPWWLDPRHIVAAMAARLEDLGLAPAVAFELEFYLVEKAGPENGPPRPASAPGGGQRPADTQVYLMAELDAWAPVLDDIAAACQAQNIPADVATVEYAPAQFEINLRHGGDIPAACDHALLLKRAVKGVAARHGLAATFMARPFPDLSTSGAHVHLSLLDRQGANAFDDGGPRGSRQLRHAIGGLAATMAEAMPIWSPNVNGFRRLAASGWVSRRVSWGYNNRNVALRVPSGPARARRIEHRPAGADANPYLVLAAVLAGVHRGLTAELDPGAHDAPGADTAAPPLPPGMAGRPARLRRRPAAAGLFRAPLVAALQRPQMVGIPRVPPPYRRSGISPPAASGIDDWGDGRGSERGAPGGDPVPARATFALPGPP